MENIDIVPPIYSTNDRMMFAWRETLLDYGYYDNGDYCLVADNEKCQDDVNVHGVSNV